MRRNTFLLCLILFLNIINLNAQAKKSPINLVQFVLTPNHNDWNYKLNEDAIIKVQVTKFGIPLDQTEIEYEFGSEMMLAERKGSIKLKDGIADINIGTLKQPGFKQLKLSVKNDEHTYKDAIKVGFSPDKIKPTETMPDDFNAFWQKAIEKNNSIPMDAKLTLMPEYSTSDVDVFLVSLQNYKKGKRLYGYLSKPKAEGKYPVILIPPGAGVKKIKPSTYYAEQGFISLAIEIHGISPELSDADYKNIKNAFGDYWFNNLDDKDNYYYKSVYLGCVRCIDFLTSLPEYDGENVVVKGGSQGGALAIVTTALDKRVKYVAAFYPALCDLTGYLHERTGGWPHLFHYKYPNNNASKNHLETASYYDVVNFAKNITVPGFYSYGYNDFTCPPTSVLSALNSITAPKKIIVTPISGHWRFPETDNQSTEWLKEKCNIK